MQASPDSLPAASGSAIEVDERDVMEVADRDAAAALLEAADEARQRGEGGVPLPASPLAEDATARGGASCARNLQSDFGGYPFCNIVLRSRARRSLHCLSEGRRESMCVK